MSNEDDFQAPPASKKPVGRPPHPTGDVAQATEREGAITRARSEFEAIRKREWPRHVQLQRRLGNVEAIARRDAQGAVVRELTEVTMRDGSKRISPVGVTAGAMPDDYVPDSVHSGSQDRSVRTLISNLLLASKPEKG